MINSVAMLEAQVKQKPNSFLLVNIYEVWMGEIFRPSSKIPICVDSYQNDWISTENSILLYNIMLYPSTRILLSSCFWCYSSF